MKLKILSLLFFCLLHAEEPKRYLPLEPIEYNAKIIAIDDLPDNWINGDPKLQSKLNKVIKNKFFWRTLSDRKQLAVGLIDLSDTLNPKTAWINGDNMMYAASMPKIAVLATAIDGLSTKTYTPDETFWIDMQAMIRYSDNQATNRVIQRFGLRKIEKVMRKYGLYDETKGGGLWVGKEFSKSGDRRGDPLKGLSHGATARKAVELFYMILTGKLGDPISSQLALSVLQSPGLHHKFVNSMLKLGYSPDRLFRKSGSWSNYHSDSIIVLGKKGQKRFILVGITETKYGEQLMKELSLEIESIVDTL